MAACQIDCPHGCPFRKPLNYHMRQPLTFCAYLLLTGRRRKDACELDARIQEYNKLPKKVTGSYGRHYRDDKILDPSACAELPGSRLPLSA